MADRAAWRTVGLLAALGLAFSVLAALGWHYQPTWEWSQPVPRFLSQQVDPGLLAARGPVGFVSDDELRSWSPFWPPAAVVLPVAGAVLGLLVGLAVLAARRRLVRRPTEAAARRALFVVLGGLGLLGGVLAAVGWHVEPVTTFLWSGGSFLPADAGYPVVGLLLGLAIAEVLARTGWRVARATGGS